MLLQVPQVLNAGELAQARSLLLEGRWVDGRTTSGPQATAVKNNLQLVAHGAAMQALQTIVLGALDRNPLVFSATLPCRVLPPMFNRYGGGTNTYGAHVDQAIRSIPGGQARLRADIACTLFLSDPLSYDGGELLVHDTYGEQRIKLPAGDLVVYPATSVHRVEPVTRGAREAAVFWIQSLVRSDEQRRLLFDMDMALMQLREAHGETPQAVALTGTYHNLLRMWSQT
jgi:PKHD-type hydroxylase